jgi:hypothetical protein
MKPFYFLVYLITFLLGKNAFAQKQLPTPINIAKTYEKNTRSIIGNPGKNYWQNSANYTIDIAFNPNNNLVNGKVVIEYVNNSPDTLNEILFKLNPNLFKKGSPRLMKINDEDATDGVILDEIIQDGNLINTRKAFVDGTNMSLRTKLLLPKNTMNFTISYHYTLNKNSHIRTGQVEEGSFFLAYFFPRIAVYDDIDGWNRNPYLGTQEFYNDFCNFKTSITVPNNYVVWATGNLQNCNAVLQEKYCNRIANAEKNDALQFVIDTNDVKENNITQKNSTTNTWVFNANNVTDVAVAFSNHYIWQSSSIEVDPTTKQRTRVDAAFNPIHLDYFLVASDARKTVEAMSYTFPKWAYPYPHETIFDGLDQMEYPMMVNDNPVENRAESIELTDHEIFHTMFPFYMGINETKYGWMDEGWATIGEWVISPIIDTSIVDLYGIAPTENAAGKEEDLPITTLTTQLYGNAMFINSYPKPALGYLYAKDALGDDLFYKGLHNYIKNWNGKHPMPNDFFYSMNTGSGKNLNWFWKKWFYGTGIVDMAITTVVGKNITITNKGEKPLPIDLLITYNDGTKEKIHRSVLVWEKGNSTVTITANGNKKIKSIYLGSTYIPDSNKKDNVYFVK